MSAATGVRFEPSRLPTTPPPPNGWQVDDTLKIVRIANHRPMLRAGKTHAKAPPQTRVILRAFALRGVELA